MITYNSFGLLIWSLKIYYNLPLDFYIELNIFLTNLIIDSRCLFYRQPLNEVATAAILVPQQALDSLVPKLPDKKDNKNQEPPKELGKLNLILLFV